MAIPHDQLLKEALAAFLEDFVTLFAPEQARGLDFSTVTLLNQEVFTELAAGSRRAMDLLAEVKTRRGAPRLVLIHGEVQRQRQSIFDRRMFGYFVSILQRHPEHLILPIALVSYPLAQGIGVGTWTMEVEGFTAVHYQYIAISLRRLNPAEYLARQQPLAVGLAALMGRPRPAEKETLYEQCLRRLTELEASGTLDDAHLYILQNLVRTYLTLTDEQRAHLLARLEQEGDTAVVTTELTWADRMRLEGEARGEARGETRGRLEGRLEALLLLLRERFGAVPDPLAARIQAISDPAALDALLIRAVRMEGLDDLFA